MSWREGVVVRFVESEAGEAKLFKSPAVVFLEGEDGKGTFMLITDFASSASPELLPFLISSICWGL